MTNICRFGSEPQSGRLPSERIFFKDGIFCTILGVQHPLCVLVDRVWHTLAKVLNVTNPSDAPRQAGKFAWSFAKAFANAALEDAVANGISLGELCASQPPQPDDVTYLDLVRFLSGEGDEILEKLRGWWLFRSFFEHCQCKAAVTPIALPASTPPQIVLPNPIPYCGGFVSGPPLAVVQQGLAELQENLRRFLDRYAERLMEFNELVAERDALAPYQILPFGYWEIGYVGYEGALGLGYQTLSNPIFNTGCGSNFPNLATLPSDRKAVLLDPAGKIEIAWLPLDDEELINASFLRAETDMVPTQPSSEPIIPAGTVIYMDDDVRIGIISQICWYIRITPYLPICTAHGGGRYGSWNSNNPAPDDTDDRAICLEFPSLCRYAKPCCGNSLPVLLTAQEQLLLAKSLGWDTSRYE